MFPWLFHRKMPHLCCSKCHATLALAVLIICGKEKNQKIFTFVARQSLKYKLWASGFRICLFEKFIIPFSIPVDLQFNETGSDVHSVSEHTSVHTHSSVNAFKETLGIAVSHFKKENPFN